MIAKSISTSTRLSEVSTFAALLFTWIIPHCDDYGHMDANPKIVKAMVVPLRDESAEDVKKALDELIAVKALTTYEAEGRPYLQVEKWDYHQTFKTDRPLNRLAPLPDDEWNPTGNQTETKRKQTAPKGREGKGREVKGTEGKEKDPRSSLEYLKKPLKEDVDEFSSRFNTTAKVIESKAEDLLLYCERSGRRYKNYKAFLLNALKRDLGNEGTRAGGKYDAVGKKKP